MRPTAYALVFLGLLLALSAALVFRSPNPYASGNDGAHGGPWTPSALMVVLLAAAAGAAALGWALVRFGGKGYTQTNTPPARR